jgi:hypothetical protein
MAMTLADLKRLADQALAKGVDPQTPVGTMDTTTGWVNNLVEALWSVEGQDLVVLRLTGETIGEEEVPRPLHLITY